MGRVGTAGRLIALVLGVALAGWGVTVWLDRPDPAKMSVFQGVRGPQGKTVLEAPAPTPLEQFDVGGDHRLAILVTDPASGWLGLVRGFRAHGVPITVTRDVDKALRHRVVLVYPIVSGRVLSGGQIRALAEHIRSGGTVVAFNLAGGGLDELFGIGSGTELASRTRLRWTAPGGVAAEDEIVVSSAGEAHVSSVGYAPGSARTLAVFDDGSVAAACRSVGGEACVLGVDLGSLAQRSMNGRAGSLARSYVNGYDPSLDVLFRWLKDRYVAGEPHPWLISTTPAGREVSILFSHDIDAQSAPHNALAYAAALKQRGLTGTFFVQTKYMRDYNDVPFFNAGTLDDLRKLVADGMDVGSHTVAHSLIFDQIPLGTGEERYPDYRPFVEDEHSVRGASILGELRVSKFLLEHLVGAQVQAFRPGRLSYPFSLPQALQGTGYHYSSSITANTVLTHLPFQLTDGRANAALQPVWEFPVTIEDEAPPRIGDRVDAADRLIGQVARERGAVVILIHPNVTDDKLRFEEAIADRWRGRAWMGSVSDFGAWWVARDRLDSDVVEREDGAVLTVQADQEIRDLAVMLPKAGREIHLNLQRGQALELELP